MNSLDHLRELFSYNDWANRRVVVALKENDCERARQIFAHLIVTEQEYFERLYGKDSTGFDFMPDIYIAECSTRAKETAERYEKLLRGFSDEGLDIVAKYRTSEGIPYQNTYRELITHVLMHSSIHRGNIIIKLRESGFEPPKIDYIIYLRETKYV